jgi:hypothetical protein
MSDLRIMYESHISRGSWMTEETFDGDFCAREMRDER